MKKTNKRYSTYKEANTQVKIPWSFQYTELKLRMILVLVLKELFVTTRYYISEDRTRINEISHMTIFTKVLWFLFLPILYPILVLKRGVPDANTDIRLSTKDVFEESLSWMDKEHNENAKVFEKIIKLNKL